MADEKYLQQAKRIYQGSKRLNLVNQGFILGAVATKLVEQGEPVDEVINEMCDDTPSKKKGA